MYNKETLNAIERTLKKKKLLCWSISIGFLWFHTYFVPRLFSSFSTNLQNIYTAIERELWACSICWIVVACHCFKSGGIIRSLLSHPAWQPLSKLTLSIYLLHMPYLVYTRKHFLKNHFNIVWFLHLHFGDACITILAAVVAYIVVEAPVGRIMDMMWESFKTSKNIENYLEEKLNFMQKKMKNCNQYFALSARNKAGKADKTLSSV